MTQDEIIELAKSINEDWWLDDIDLQAFAKLVVEKEQDGNCKKCKDGCPACDARKLPNDLL